LTKLIQINFTDKVNLSNRKTNFGTMKILYHLPILKISCQIEGGFFETAPDFLSENYDDFGRFDSLYDYGSEFDYSIDLQRSLQADDSGISARVRDKKQDGLNIFDYLNGGTFDNRAFTDGLLDALAAYDDPLAIYESQFEPEIEGGFEFSTDERYFFTTTTTTSTTTTTTTTTTASNVMSCWKCDSMTYSNCASSGRYEECQSGDSDCCFIEIREKYQSLQQLCTGCKSENACENLMSQNFAVHSDADSDTNIFADQCRPNYFLQRRNFRFGSQQSVCRQCFTTCNSGRFDGKYCFGSITGNVGVETMIPFETSSGEYRGVYRPEDTLALGIPTWLLLDATLDSTAVTEIENFNQHNIYFNDQTNGKIYQIAGDNKRTLNEMTYWGIQGAKRAWWRSDLKNLQKNYQLNSNTNGQNGCVSNGAIDGSLEFSGCSAFDAINF